MYEPSTIYWDVSPVLLEIGPFMLRWYGLLFGLAFVLGYYLVRWMYRQEGKPERDLDRLLVYMVVGTVVGARLGHVLFYDPGYYFNHPIEILMIWQGGLASHGGALGILTALYLYARPRPDQSYLWLLDRMVVPTALSGFFIRLGNLFNSEILGTPTDLPWAFVFGRIDAVPRHPAQLYEALGYGLIFVALLAVYRRYRGRTPRGLLLGLFLVGVFSYRFLVEFVKMPQAVFGETLPLSMGQLLSIPLILAGLVLLARALTGRAGPERPTKRPAPGVAPSVPRRTHLNPPLSQPRPQP
jgi:prolipoprotein diacylglyceryl transferase